MQESQRSADWLRETECLKEGFQELIVSREAIRAQLELLKDSRRTTRQLKRVEKSIQRHALNLLQGLFELGMTRAEIGRIYGEAEKVARVRSGVVS